MKFIPNWIKTLFHLLYMALVNPFVIAAIFFVLWEPLAQETSTNVGKLPGWAIPIWIAASMIIAGIVTAIQFGVARLIAKTSYAEFRRIDTIAQLPYLLFIFFSLLFMTSEIEGNIMGFIFFPAYIVLSLISIPISFILSAVQIWRARD